MIPVHLANSGIVVSRLLRAGLILVAAFSTGPAQASWNISLGAEPFRFLGLARECLLHNNGPYCHLR